MINLQIGERDVVLLTASLFGYARDEYKPKSWINRGIVMLGRKTIMI